MSTDPTPLDVKAIADKWLNQCGSCDLGMPEYGCTHPSGDYRPVIMSLVDEVVRLHDEVERSARVLAEVRSINDQMTRLGDHSSIVAAWVERDELRKQRDQARAEVERLTTERQRDAEIVAEAVSFVAAGLTAGTGAAGKRLAAAVDAAYPTGGETP